MDIDDSASISEHYENATGLASRLDGSARLADPHDSVIYSGMCNLYRMRSNVDELRQFLGAFEGDRGNLKPRKEIYPGQMAPILRIVNGTLTLDEIAWGVPPSRVR